LILNGTGFLITTRNHPTPLSSMLFSYPYTNHLLSLAFKAVPVDGKQLNSLAGLIFSDDRQ
jgi:hypothetical protein